MSENIITLSEFERLCAERGFSSFTISKIFSQHGISVGGSPVISEYKEVKVFLSPNVVLFQSGSSYLFFRHAVEVRIVKDTEESGIVFELICTVEPSAYFSKLLKIAAEFTAR